jgi:hypothetical protein
LIGGAARKFAPKLLKGVLKTGKAAFPAATGFAAGVTTAQSFGPAVGPSVGGGGMQAARGMGCPTGFRLNKSTYVTRGGGTSRWPRQLVVHEKGTECVKRRKINPGNGRAATRAVRRLVSFYRLSRRVAKQLQVAARGAKIGSGRRRGRLALPAGRGDGRVTVVDTD